MIVLLLLVSCAEAWLPCAEDFCGEAVYPDVDGDGHANDAYREDDCNDMDASTYPGAAIYCDSAEMALELDRDCDGERDAITCGFAARD